tara:strand:- start:283 stop:894 length:612 start_codon:yes stop_codon:yes gene_type:complete
MFKNQKIIKILVKLILISFLLNSCIGSSSVGVFGSGVSVAYDPRTVGMQIDDSIMQKNLMSRLALTEKKYLLSISIKILDGNIFLSGKVNEPEEKLKITKLAWETKGVRSVKSAIAIKGKTNFKGTAKDVLITSQLRTALIFNKLVKATNYNIDTINGKTYIFGIAMTIDEKKEVIKEAQEVYGVKKIIPSIILVEELSRSKN